MLFIILALLCDRGVISEHTALLLLAIGIVDHYIWTAYRRRKVR